MSERKGVVTFKGNPLTLTGEEIKTGDKAPDVSLWTLDLQDKKISSLLGDVTVLSSVPSLDTPVCSMETKRLDKESTRLGANVRFITVSRDTPFAQKRWAEANDTSHVTLLSDFREAEFGKRYGVLIKELALLARVVFVLDKEGVVRYIQVVKEVADEPNYDEVLEQIKKLA